MKHTWRICLAALFLMAISLTGCNADGFTASQGQEIGQRAEVNYKENQDKEEASLSQEQEPGNLSVTYLDVGQGNAILAESQGEFMLIDGGARETSSFVVSYLKKQGIEKLDYILISHFDEDHLAGAIGALHSFPVGTLITPDYTTDSSIYKSYREAVKEAGYQPLHPEIGDVFGLGSAEFRVISPVAYGHEDENQDSVGIILENGENKFYIGGDIGLQGEKEILGARLDIQAEVCLMNHHGSHVSRDFFQAVNPSYAVISCGDGNSYGHPRQDTVELIESFHVPLFRTDKQGTITARSDGQRITFDQEPCNDYTPGEKNHNGQGNDNQREETEEVVSNATPDTCDFVLNIHTKKIHKPDCTYVSSIDQDNRAYFKGEKEELLEQGYTVCKGCLKE